MSAEAPSFTPEPAPAELSQAERSAPLSQEAVDHEFGQIVAQGTASQVPQEWTPLVGETVEAEEHGGFLKKARKIAVGEGIGTAVEAGLMAAGVALPVRELVGTGIDVKTYSSDDSESIQTRRQKVRRAAGVLALNLATGYAIQKGMPGFVDMISDSIEGTNLETGFQLAGKIGAMTGATSLMNRRFGG